MSPGTREGNRGETDQEAEVHSRASEGRKVGEQGTKSELRGEALLACCFAVKSEGAENFYSWVSRILYKDRA